MADDDEAVVAGDIDMDADDDIALEELEEAVVDEEREMRGGSSEVQKQRSLGKVLCSRAPTTVVGTPAPVAYGKGDARSLDEGTPHGHEDEGGLSDV